MQTTQRYTIIVGLFDKVTHKQKVTTKSAMDFVSSEATNAFGGATIYPSKGVYTHNDGSLVQEPSIVIMTMDDGSKVDSFVNRIKHTLNQESVLVQKESVEFAFA